MNSSPFIFILITSFSLSSAQPSFWFHACGKTGNFTSNSKFESNLNTFLSSITSGNRIIGGDAHFYNFTIGTKPSDDGFLSGEAYCRGDLSLSDCHSCCTDAAGEIRQICPNQKEAIGWYRDCTIRYSNRAIVGTSESFPRFAVANPSNATDPKGFTKDLTTLLKNLQLKSSAAFPLKYASGWRNVNGNGSDTVYAVLQCTGDLNVSACSKCVQNIIDYVPSCCYGKKGGVILTPNCASRFDVYQFYRSGDEIDTPSLDNDHSRRKRKSLRLTVFIATPICVASLLAVGILIIRRWRKIIQNTDKDIEEIIVAESLQFDLATIKAATCNFSLDNKLGEGGFGEVYKGRLGNGQEIAVKRLSKNSGQGVKELKTEVVLVAKLQHKNLVKLLGFCIALKEKILVYEFLPNSSLDQFLFDPTNTTPLDWKTRLKIIIGIARGLLYLHEDSRLMVIHRDLKTSNILLDESMNPKISDFGLAKLFVMDQTQGDTRRIVGTYGYMAPEYAMTGHFSVKSDVFSFGVIILEIVSGQKVNGYLGEQQLDEALVYRAWRLWNEGRVMDLVDPSLQNQYEMEQVLNCVHIGLLSIQQDPVRRPRMTTIVASLNGDSISLPMPRTPQFLGNNESKTNSYSTDVNITNVHPR